MTLAVRCWVALAAVGTGLIYLALVIESTGAMGALLAIVGVTAFGWGLLVMFDGRFLAPRVTVIAALVPIALWLAVVLLQTAGVGGMSRDFRPLPLTIATVLELFVAAAVAVHLRRGGAPPPSSAHRQVLGIALGVLVIGAAVVPAIASTGLLVVTGSPDDGVHH